MVWNPIFRDAAKRRMTGSAGQKRVPTSFFEQFKIPLPPLPEQRKIAAILDKADAVRRKRQQTLELADQFLRSAFIDMFGDPVTNPKGWPIKKLSEAFATDIEPTKCGPFGSALRKHEYTDSGVPVLTMNNIVGNSFCLDGCLHITQEKYQDLSTYAVREGDIIISRAGTVGKMCVVPHLDGPAIISTNLIRLSLDGRILEPAFFVALMTYCRGRVGKLRTGNDDSYTFMNTGILRGLPVPFPSPTVQADWVRLLSWMSQHVSNLSGHKEIAQDLSTRLVQQAFRGEL
jgi:type I restriction enzyme S subunit